MNANEKRCGGKCRKIYRKAAGSVRAFDPHAGKPDGLQPFCRMCDWDAKHSPHRGWTRFLAEKRGLIKGISEFEYRQIIACNRCEWCHGPLFKWGGYWLDRRDSRGHYEPGNVVPCCRWCNHYKNDMPEEMWKPMIGGLIQRFGTGNGEHRWLDWESLHEMYRSSRPDISRLEVQDICQPQLFDLRATRIR